MTVTIVYGKASDGYLYSADDGSATTARNGSVNSVNGGTTGWMGMSRDDEYEFFQTFIGFDYTAIPSDQVVVSAAIKATTANMTGSMGRIAEARGYAWSPGGLTAADWRNPAQLAALGLRARHFNIQNSFGEHWLMGSDELCDAVAGTVSQEFVLTTDRQRTAALTVDEQMAIHTADANGTTNDPYLIFTTTPRSRAWPANGGMTELSAGGWAYISSYPNPNGNGTLYSEIRYMPPGGLVSGDSQLVATLLLGNESPSAFYDPMAGTNGRTGVQGLTLIADSASNLYVLSRSAMAENSLAVQAFKKGSGATWTAQPLVRAALPSYDGAINNVAAAWHDVAGGTIMAVCGHAAGSGDSTGPADLSYLLLSSVAVLAGNGNAVRGTGNAAGTFIPGSVKSGWFSTYSNEVGSCLDVQAAGGQNPRWGYAASVSRTQLPGDNGGIALGRYIINTTGTGLEHASVEQDLSWGVKDATAKLRVLRISDTTAALITADPDPGWGISISIMQHSGTDAGSVELGSAVIDETDLPGLPAPAVLGTSLAWDAVYNPVQNQIWIYYMSTTVPGDMFRAGFSLDTYALTGETRSVYSGSASTVMESIRVPRNAWVRDRCLVQLARNDAGTRSSYTFVDRFNLAPTEPLTVPKVNYDATLAATFSWTFNDPNPGDTPSAHQLQIVDTVAGTTALDTGKVLSTFSSRVVNGGTLVNGKSYQWRVKTWDALDAESPWSVYSAFRTSAGGAVTITDPAVDNESTLITDERQVSWSVTGTVQASYKIVLTRLDTGAVVSDTGWVASTATTALVTGMVSDVPHSITVTVRNASNIASDVGVRLLLPSYATPEQPLITLHPSADEGFVEVRVENPFPGQPVNDAPVWSAEPGENLVTGWTLTAATWAASTDQAHQGAQSAKLTTIGTPVQASVRAPVLPVTPGQRYTCRFWVYSAIARTVTASIDWSAGGPSTFAQAVPAGTWTLVAVTGTAPAGAVTATYGPTLAGSPAAGSIVYVDQLAMPQASDRPDVARNLILRRAAGASRWEVAGETVPDGTFRDYDAPAGVELEYKARGVA